MRIFKQYLPIIAAMLCMLLVLGVSVSAEGSDPMEQLRFLDRAGDQELSPFYDGTEDTYYLFLPAYASPEQVRVSGAFGTAVYGPDGAVIDTLGGFPVGEPLALTVSRYGSEKVCRLQLMQCENIPALFIEIQPGGMDRILEGKDHTEDVFVQVISPEGSVMLKDLAVMNGRGNGTWKSQDKRPYNLSFSSAKSLGPFENISKLCLTAEYSDESKMRNAIAYYCGKKLDIPYATDYMHTDVYVNGDYMGLYGISTKQEYEKFIRSHGIQAVFELSSGVNVNEFVSTIGQRTYNVMYGNTDEVRQKVDSLEQALDQQDWSACAQLLDLDSFAEKYALDEFVGNIDMGYASQYFYLDQEGVIHSMLPWDYDWSLGSALSFFNTEHAYGLMTGRFPDYWAAKLRDNEAFSRAVAHTLQADYTDSFLEDLKDYTLELDGTIAASRLCDQLRWKNGRPFRDDPYQSGFGDLSMLSEFFCGYFEDRRDHLLSYFSAPDDFCLVEFNGGAGYYFNYLIPRGEKLSDYLRDREKLSGVHAELQVVGWNTASGETPETLDVITEDTVFHLDSIDLDQYWEPELQENTLGEKLRYFGIKIVILGMFGMSALGLLAVQLRHLFRKERVEQ